MQKYIEQLVEKVEKCKEERDMFSLPVPPESAVLRTEPHKAGLVLFGKCFFVEFPNQGRIEIVYESKDACRTFQTRPDRSVIEIKVFDMNGVMQKKISDAWDEGYL